MANNFNTTEINVADQNKESVINNGIRDVVKALTETNTFNFATDANTTPTVATVRLTRRILTTSSGSLTATRDLILPLEKHVFTITNGTTGGQMIRVIGSSGTGVNIPPGATCEVICDGTNFLYSNPGVSIYSRKTADQTLIGTAYADITELGLPVAASTTYEFEFNIIADADATTTGIDVAVNGPTIGAGTINYTQIYWTSGTARTERIATTYDANTASTGSQGTTRAVYTVKGIFTTGATAGTLAARIKREAVGTGPNVRIGSWGRLTKLT